MSCPRCGCPLAELLPTGAEHAAADGPVRYHRCVCGAWLVQVGDLVVGATR